MKVVIDGIEYIEKPKEPTGYKMGDCIHADSIRASNEEEVIKLYNKFEPLCPECGRRAFPTNFPPEAFDGKKNDKSIVWFCSDMGHCAFSIDEDIKWQLKEENDK